MATSETRKLTADDRAWDLFFEALDADSRAAARIPPGAAIVAADAANRDDLLHRYHADRRSVVLVDANGGFEVRRPPIIEFDALRALLASIMEWLRRQVSSHSKV